VACRFAMLGHRGNKGFQPRFVRLLRRAILEPFPQSLWRCVPAAMMADLVNTLTSREFGKLLVSSSEDCSNVRVLTLRSRRSAEFYGIPPSELPPLLPRYNISQSQDVPVIIAFYNTLAGDTSASVAIGITAATLPRLLLRTHHV